MVNPSTISIQDLRTLLKKAENMEHFDCLLEALGNKKISISLLLDSPSLDFNAQTGLPSEFDQEYLGLGLRFIDENHFEAISFDLKSLTPIWIGNTYSIKGKSGEGTLRKYLLRFFYPHIPVNERVLIDFIFDRTLGWGKREERISKWHFKDGLININQGTGLSEPTINKALKSLEKKKFITVFRNANAAPVYRLNFDRMNSWLISEKKGIVKDSKEAIYKAIETVHEKKITRNLSARSGPDKFVVGKDGFKIPIVERRDEQNEYL